MAPRGPRVRLSGGWLFGAALASLLLGGCSRPDTPPPPPPDPPDKVEHDMVTEALHTCLTLDCERAFAHISTLPPTSPVRGSDAFQAVVYRYYADRLLRADIEPDLTKRRAAFQSVVDSPGVDTSLILAANERISRLGAQVGSAQEIAINATTTAAAEVAAQTADLLARSRSKSAADQNLVRAKLEPKVFAGKATAEDVAMLRTVCKAQKDSTCLRQLERLILP